VRARSSSVAHHRAKYAQPAAGIDAHVAPSCRSTTDCPSSRKASADRACPPRWTARRRSMSHRRSCHRATRFEMLCHRFEHCLRQFMRFSRCRKFKIVVSSGIGSRPSSRLQPVHADPLESRTQCAMIRRLIRGSLGRSRSASRGRPQAEIRSGRRPTRR
jgi:hypothetical protein